MILSRLGKTLVMEVAPALEGQYVGGHASLSGLMAVMAGEAWDGAADRLWREIGGLRDLLAAAGVEVGDEPASLRLSDLNGVRDRLSEQLIALQARLEMTDSDAARALNAQIWGFLLAGAAERMPSPPQFPDIDES